jgi:ribonuclease D
MGLARSETEGEINWSDSGRNAAQYLITLDTELVLKVVRQMRACVIQIHPEDAVHLLTMALKKRNSDVSL